jgi:hypothetical protein
MQPATLRFAVLHEDGRLADWQARCVQELLALGGIKPQLLIVRESCTDMPSILAGAAQILLPAPVAPAIEHPATHATVARIRHHALDFALNFLNEPCPAELLDVPRYGAWRFHFGDWTRYRGNPPGFWEVYDGEFISGALLGRELQSHDAVIILRDGHFRTDLRSAARNRAMLETRVAFWAAQVCTDIRNGVTDRFRAVPVTGATMLHTPPTRMQHVRCSMRAAIRALRLAWQSLFRHDQWNVGLVEQPIAAFLRHEKRAPVRWLPATKRNELRADPFGVMRDGHLSILCEHMSYDDMRGYIIAIESMSASRAVRVAIGPVNPVHMSYPFLIHADQRVLCIPETSEAHEIALYESEHFPDRWAKVATLIAGAAIVDATLFQYDGHRWLAGSELADRGANCELHLWYAPSITGPWHPHPANPVKIDVRSARPGGTPFVVDGTLYRPAQDCSRTYGGRITINRVLTLNPLAFREEPFAFVEPDAAGPYPDGLHTLSQVGNVTLIDGKRVLFVPAQFRRVLLKKLASVFKRSRIPAH